MTVLRSPIYAHHDPHVPDPNEQYQVIDQGMQQFSYALLAHAGSWEQAETVRRARELNVRPLVLAETYHAGALPQQQSYVHVDRANIIVSALKQAEDSADLILRCYEAHRVATEATICMAAWGRSFSASFAPCEIKTFRVPRDVSQPVSETDLIEWR